MATEEITISELELADEVLADMTLPVDTATETRAVTLKQLRAWLGSALPVGSVFASVGKLDDERFTLLDGKTLSRTGTYEAFCNKVVSNVQAGIWKSCTEEEFNQEVSAKGQCGKFVVSSDYIRIPKFGNTLYSSPIDGKIPVFGNGKIIGLTDGSSNFGMRAGQAGSQWYLTSSTSAYGKNAGTQNTGTDANSNRGMGLTKDASNSGIEGKLETSYVEVYYYMVISTEGQTEEVEVDINKIYEDMNLKANSDLSNASSVASSFKKQSVSWAMPSGKYIQYTDLVTETSNYYSITADAVADGYFSMSASMNSTGGTLDISNHTTGMKSKVEAPQNNRHIGCFLPVKKGDRVKCGLNTSTEWWIRFYYAEGEK